MRADQEADGVMWTSPANTGSRSPRRAVATRPMGPVDPMGRLARAFANRFARYFAAGLLTAASLVVTAPLATAAAAGPAPAATTGAAPLTATVGVNPRTFTVIITDSGFSPSHIVSVLGQPLTIKVSNQGTRVHEFAIPGYYIFTANMNPGTNTSVGFTPNQPGQFVIMSDPSGKDQPEFTGKLTITDAK